jgi:hypothetical protein
VKTLQQQVNELARQPGPQGPQGAEGQQGPPGPSTGPAGGDLTGSYPDPLIGSNAVGSSEIADEAVGIDDIARNAVGGSQIADNSVTSEDIASNSINNSDMGDNAISSAEIANGNVLSVDLGGSAVQAANLGSAFAVAGTGVLVSPGTSQEATVSCPGNSGLLSPRRTAPRPCFPGAWERGYGLTGSDASWASATPRFRPTRKTCPETAPSFRS